MKKNPKRVLVSYVSLNRDLGGPGPGIGGDERRPVTTIARTMKEKGFPPDVVRLLWETRYLREKGKAENERQALKEKVSALLPRAEVMLRDVVWSTVEDAGDYAKSFGKLKEAFATIDSDYGADAEIFVNVSTGTHAVQAALVVLAARNPRARIVLFGRDPDDPGKDYCEFTNLVEDTLAVEEREARDAASAAKRDTPEVDLPVAEKVLRIAPVARDPILLLGETGTGKTRLAGEIAKRRGISEDKFVAVNCATLGRLADSELFGHVKGAFTDAKTSHTGFVKQADGGLLFLDEIGLLSPAVQGKLLKVLDDGVFRPVGAEKTERSDFFLVCGTNETLSKNVVENKFRRDLYERIRTWTFELRPIWERSDEVPELVDSFLVEFKHDAPSATRSPRFSPAGRNALLDRIRNLLGTGEGRKLFAGNIRTLKRLVRRLATKALVESGGEIGKNLVDRELDELQAPSETETPPQAAALPDGGSDERTAAVAAVIRNLSDKKSKPFRPLKRIQLEYVIGLFVAGRTTGEIERELFPEKSKSRSQALYKFLAGFGKNFRVGTIRKEIEAVRDGK